MRAKVLTAQDGRQAVRLRARMRMLFRRAIAQVDAVAQAEGLSPAQYHVLLALAAEAGEADLGQSDLVRHLETSRAHVSMMVRALVDAGLVREWRPPGDRRQLRLAVTRSGWSLLERLGERQEAVLHSFVAALDPAEIGAIVDEIANRYLGLTRTRARASRAQAVKARSPRIQ